MTEKVTEIYSGRIIRLTTQRVQLPNQHRCELEVIHHPGGVAIIAVDDQQRVCMLRHYRHAAGGWLWEIPAGKIEKDEAVHLTAQRELEEEAGVHAQQWQSLGHTVTSPGVLTEVIHFFGASQLSYSVTRLEQDELLHCMWIPLTTAQYWIALGEISDAKTIIGIQRYLYQTQILNV